MSAGNVPADGGAGGVPVPAQEVLARMKVGETANAVVSRDLGQGKYQLAVGGKQATIHSEVPLEVRQPVRLEAVEGEGRTVLRVVVESSGEGSAVSAGSGQADLVRATDQATLPANFRLAVPAEQTAEHLSASGDTPPAVSISFTENGVRIQFADGTVAQATIVSAETPMPPAPAAAGQPPVVPATDAVVAELVSEAVPVTTGGEPAAAAIDTNGAAPRVALPLPAGGQGVFFVEQISLPIRLEGLSPASMAAMIDLDPSSAGSVLSTLTSGEGSLQIPVVPQDATAIPAILADSSVLLRVAAALDSLAAGETVPVRLAGEAILGGSLQVSRPDATPIPAGQVERELMAAGVSVTERNLEAARALLSEAVPVTRQTVGQLIALTAGVEEAVQSDLLMAGARLLSRGLPITLPMAEGMRDMLAESASVGSRLQQALSDLAQVSPAGESPPALPPAVQQPVQAAAAALRSLFVSLDGNNPPGELASFLSTFGRETLAQAEASLRQAAQSALSGNAGLSNADSALAVLPELTPGSSGAMMASQSGPQGGAPDGSVLQAQTPLPSQTAAAPLLTPLTLTEAEQLGDAVARLVRATPTPEQPANPAASPEASDTVTATRIARALLAAPSPEEAAAAARELAERGSPELVRAVRVEVERLEGELVRQDPTLQRLGDVSETVRDLGRRFMAYRAESVVGTRQDPAFLVSEIPFRAYGEEGNGRLQLFYRRGARRGSKAQWSARVLLDLETTNLGPVVGDLRFKDKNLQLKLFSKDAATADFLAADVDDLMGALREKGFTLEPSFPVIPQDGDPAPPPRPLAERALPAAPRGILDIEA